MIDQKTTYYLGDELHAIGIEQAAEVQTLIDEITEHEIEQRTETISNEAYDAQRELKVKVKLLQENIEGNLGANEQMQEALTQRNRRIQQLERNKRTTAEQRIKQEPMYNPTHTPQHPPHTTTS